MESNLHVEVSHSPHGPYQSRQPSTPFCPSQRLVVLNYYLGNTLFSVANSFLKSTPPLLILQTPICSSNHKHLRGNFIPKFHSQMKRSIPVWHISPVKQSGNGISLFFLRN
ncbi:hypothetical protein V8G54_029139 [Vigna mungo]|uniref:Uncharacterized protein n=1 Tax=Vigna mungo TaxID=3915 RepID=A0AAQ3RLJ6_VIGMU